MGIVYLSINMIMRKPVQQSVHWLFHVSVISPKQESKAQSQR
jgi:hypothetical protein